MGVIDLTGQQFGRLTVLERTEKPEGVKSRSAYWLCQCNCENKTILKVQGANLRNGNTTSCGCYQKEKASQTHFKDLAGQRFGKLLVIKPLNQGSGQHIRYLCHCDCGNQSFEAYGNNLVRGATNSCGCSKYQDIAGLIRNDFKAIEHINGKKSSNGAHWWRIECIHCGEQREISIDRFKREALICGCQNHKYKSQAEKRIMDLLDNNNIKYIKEKQFDNLINPNTNRPLRIDFFLTEYNIALEIDGKQHFVESSGTFKEKYSLMDIQYLDNLKNIWCHKNNINIIRIPYYDISNITIKDLTNINEDNIYLIKEDYYE